MILVVNAGSTSLKCKLYDMPGERVLAACRVERVGDRERAIFHYENPIKGLREDREGLCLPRYADAVALFLDRLLDAEAGAIPALNGIARVGFKTVLAKDFFGVHELTGEVLEAMEAYLPVAPAHNGPYLEAIRQLRPLLPKARFIGAFETAFHADIPLARALYGAPWEWYARYGVRRYGYHGASHEYVADFVAKARGGRTGRLISCHLGGSGSLCAIENGKSVDTSFGFSLQTGLIQSNRVGDMDAFVVPFMLAQGLTMAEIEQALSKNGGLKGISGTSGDMRDVQNAADAGEARAELAIDMYVNGIVKYIGAFWAEMGGLDALAFAGGIGERAPRIRARVCEALRPLGVWLDAEKNTANRPDSRLSRDDSPVAVYAVATDEELVVARKTAAWNAPEDGGR